MAPGQRGLGVGARAALRQDRLGQAPARVGGGVGHAERVPARDRRRPTPAAAPQPRARACSASVIATFSSASGGQCPAGNASGRTTCRRARTNVSASAQAARSASRVAGRAVRRRRGPRRPAPRRRRRGSGRRRPRRPDRRRRAWPRRRRARSPGPRATGRARRRTMTSGPVHIDPSAFSCARSASSTASATSSKRPRRTSSSARPVSAAAAMHPADGDVEGSRHRASASSQRPSRSRRTACVAGQQGGDRARCPARSRGDLALAGHLAPPRRCARPGRASRRG